MLWYLLKKVPVACTHLVVFLFFFVQCIFLACMQSLDMGVATQIFYIISRDVASGKQQSMHEGVI